MISYSQKDSDNFLTRTKPEIIKIIISTSHEIIYAVVALVEI